MKLNKIIASLLLVSAATSVFAQTSVYMTDSRGGLVKNNSGQCWRTGYWNAVDAANDPHVCECDPASVSELVCKRDFSRPQVNIEQPRQMNPVAQPRIQNQPKRITLREDISFKFAQFALQQQGKNELDNVVNVANEVAAEKIVITGYTDRIGSEKANLVLSQRRADSVKNYLVEKGLPFNMITAKGLGESQPITGRACDGLGSENHKNKNLIECLAPDRRVDIDIYGTK